MLIQWNSGAAQEALSRLRRTKRGLEDCLQQSQTVRSSLQEANPDGENQTLKKALDRFESCEKKLRQLLDDVELYETGVEKADDGFSEAEQSAVRLVGELSGASPAPVTGGGVVRFVRWEPAAYATIPEMRVHAAPMPSWLEDAVMEKSADHL